MIRQGRGFDPRTDHFCKISPFCEIVGGLMAIFSISCGEYLCCSLNHDRPADLKINDCVRLAEFVCRSD